MATQKEFDAAVARVKTLTKDPGNAKKLALYGLYKQATMGDVTGKKPGMLQIAERAKWEAWQSCEGLSAEDARADYVALVDELLEDESLRVDGDPSAPDKRVPPPRFDV